MFSSKWWWKPLQAFVGVALEVSFDFQQILVPSKSENTRRDKKEGEKYPVNPGRVNYSCEGWQAVPPHGDYREASRSPSTVHVAFLQLPTESAADQENPTFAWQTQCICSSPLKQTTVRIQKNRGIIAWYFFLKVHGPFKRNLKNPPNRDRLHEKSCKHLNFAC